MSSHSGQIEHIELRPDYSIPRMINGGWQLASGHDERLLDRSAALLDLQRLARAGLTAFDGADIYTGVETLYGELRRSATDLGPIRVHTKFVPDFEALPTLTKSYVRKIVDRSLQRLGVSRLDLVQFHWWDWQFDGWLDTAGWLDELRQEGKIEYLGVTNFDTRRLSQILEGGIEIVSHQVQYSLLDRRPERSMVELCRRHGVYLLCYGTLAGGFLSRRWLGEPDPEMELSNRSLIKYRLVIEELGGWPAFQNLLGILDRIARRQSVSIANVATRWVLDRPQVAAAIVGVRNAEHLADNLQTFGFRWEVEDRAQLDGFLADHPGIAGDIYSVERVREGRHAVIMKTGLNHA